MPNYRQAPIQCRPGIQSTGDGIQPSENEGVTGFWVAGNKIRFPGGWPQSMQGTESITLTTTNRNAAAAIIGVVRTKKYINLAGTDYYFIGSTLGLYAYDGSAAWNITPLQTSNTAIANSLATQFDALGSNPIATTSGSGNIVVTHASHGLRTGDSVTITGAATTNNITNVQINTTFTVTVLTSSTYRVTTAGTANATGSGGGAGVSVGTGRIRVTHNTHGFAAGYRVKLSGAADTGGILAANINTEFTIRAVATNTYDVYASTNATSAVSAAGGASTVDYAQISMADGASYPTIWSIDKFGDYMVSCPGNARGIYSWAGTTSTSAALISGAPAQANGIFVLNGKLCAYGTYSATAANQKDNRVANSNAGDFSDWTIAGGSQAYEDVKEEADRFIGHAISGDRVYLFTETRIFTNDDIGGADIWDFNPFTNITGAVAQGAIYEVDTLIYVMGGGNIYRINGGIIEPLLNDVDLNAYSLFVGGSRLEVRKGFIYYIRKWNELHFVMPYRGTYISYSPQHGWWTFGGTLDRTAMMSNHPANLWGINAANTLYTHGDSGANAYNQWDGADLGATITTNWRSFDGGINRGIIHGLRLGGQFNTGLKIYLDYKDGFMSDDMSDYDTLGPFTVTDSSLDQIEQFLGPVSTMYWRWRFANDTSSYGFRLSGFVEYVTKGSPY